MDRDRHAERVAEANSRQQMRVERVHAAAAQQREQVQGATAFLQRAAEIYEWRELLEFTRRDRLGDPHHVLGDDPAGAEIEMPDFAVPDLPFG